MSLSNIYVMLSYVLVKYAYTIIVYITLKTFSPLQLGPHKDYPITSKITIKIIEETVVDLKVVFVQFIA
jgi:hypothetical protein